MLMSIHIMIQHFTWYFDFQEIHLDGDDDDDVDQRLYAENS